jgi:hypothetical protein
MEAPLGSAVIRVERDLSDKKQSTLHVNGVDLNVTDQGKGSPALVFLHVWGGSSRIWSDTIDDLAKAHRCIALDFRGWGNSQKGPIDYDLDTLASDVLGSSRSRSSLLSVTLWVARSRRS